MDSLLNSIRGSRARRNPDGEADDTPAEGIPVLTKYNFAEVPIPDGFLTVAPPDAQPITYQPVSWLPELPENEGGYAVVLDNVISPTECDALLQLAEASVPEADRGKSGRRFWRPALVNVGGGFEVLESGYRNSDRIIWDEQTVMDRLWARCETVPEVRSRLAVVEDDPDVLGRSKWGDVAKGLKKQRWEFRRFNKRMRFLKYGPEQFFKGELRRQPFSPRQENAGYADPRQRTATGRIANRDPMVSSCGRSSPYTYTSTTPRPRTARRT